MPKPKKFLLTLFFCFLVSLSPRLYKINSPIADIHSHRQADTASVTKNLLNHTGRIFVPTYHDLSNVQSGLENPHGYRMVEFPIFNIFSAFTYMVFHFFGQEISIDLASRLTSAIFGSLSGIIIFFLVLAHSNNYLAAFLSSLFFGLLPFNIYYSRCILPESLAVFLFLTSLYFFKKNLIISSIFLSLSALVKPYVLLLCFPYCAFVSYKSIRSSPKVIFKYLLFLSISLIPLILWRQWIKNYPAGIPANTWLLNNNAIRFKPAWFRWLFFERISILIFGSYLLFPFLLGFFYKKNNSIFLNYSLLAGVLLYFSIFASGNIQHEYYQLLIIPSLTVSLGFGLYYQLHFLSKNKFISYSFSLIIVLFGLAFSFYKIKDYYNINNPIIIEAGEMVDKLTPPNAKIVAPYTGDTAFLYQTNRSGWPTEIYDTSIFQTISSPIYLVSVNFDDYTNHMLANYPTIYRTDKYIILQLK